MQMPMMSDSMKKMWRETIPDSSFNMMMERVTDALRNFFDSGDYTDFAPTLHVFVWDKDDTVEIRPFRLNLPKENKHQNIANQCSAFAMSEPRPYLSFFLASPSYYIERPDTDDPKHLGPVKDQPDRMEGLAVMGITPDMRIGMSLLKVERRGKRGYITISETMTVEADYVDESRMSPILNAVLVGYTEGYYEHHVKNRKARRGNVH